jgi:hypothetical protein
MKIISTHLDRLMKSPFCGEAWVGITPEIFASRLDPCPEKVEDFWKKSLRRSDLKTICQNREIQVLSAYVAVMAWGGQGRGHPQTTWNQRFAIEKKLNKIKSQSPDREEAFSMFIGEGRIRGLGPSYFTKLLYFFNKNPMYIMDLWTSLSVNLLTGTQVVPVSSHYIHSRVTPAQYSQFCEVVDEIARRTGYPPDQIEMRMFDGANPNSESWRNFVKSYYKINV